MVQDPVVEGLQPNADVLTIHIVQVPSARARLAQFKDRGAVADPDAHLERNQNPCRPGPTKCAKNEIPRPPRVTAWRLRFPDQRAKQDRAISGRFLRTASRERKPSPYGRSNRGAVITHQALSRQGFCTGHPRLSTGCRRSPWPGGRK